MSEPCWYKRFDPTGPPCERPGIWKLPDDPRERGGVGRALLAAMRWCDEHRHATDVLDTTTETEHADG